MFTLRRKKRIRKKRLFSIEKLKTISSVHMRYILLQVALAASAFALLKTDHVEPFRFLIFSMVVCGCFAFPTLATKAINRALIRDHESSGVWGNWILHISVCLGLIRSIIPFESSFSWTMILTASVMLSFLLLLLSTRRTACRFRKRSS